MWIAPFSSIISGLSVAIIMLIVNMAINKKKLKQSQIEAAKKATEAEKEEEETEYEKEHRALIEANRALLHDRLYQAYQYYLRVGCITADDWDNLEYMYKPYRTINGNGTCELLRGKATNKLSIVSKTDFEKRVKELKEGTLRDE